MTAAEIKKSKLYTPGLIGGEVVHFLVAGHGFFLRHDTSKDFLKDDSGKAVVLPEKDVIEARQLYLSCHNEVEF